MHSKLTRAVPGVAGAGPSLARSTAVMTLGTLISRGTGVLRLAAMAAALGIAETRLTDTYNIANTVPNIVYELVLGGVVTSIFVPVFVEVLQKENRDRAWEVISGILNLSLLALTVISIAGVIAAPWIARFYALRLEGVEVSLQEAAITFLLRLFMPQIVLYGLYFVLSGILNAHKRFGVPMWTPIANNVVLIAVFVIFHRVYGPVSLDTVTREQLLVIGLGTTLSVAPMGLLLIPYMRGLAHYRATLSLKDPSVRKLAGLSVFVIASIAANQLGYIAIQWLANQQRGAYSAYLAAWTFFIMPVGLFVWSISTALTPSMSEEALNQRWQGFADRVSTGIRAIAFLTLPTALGYLVIAPVMVRVLIQHGVATAQSTALVTGVLRFLVLGLVQFSLYQLATRAFYSMQDARTPFFINAGVIGATVALAVPLFWRLGIDGIALGQSIANSLGMVWLISVLKRRTRTLDVAALAGGVARMAIAAAAMALVVWGIHSAGEALWVFEAFLPTAALLFALVVAGVASYVAFSALLNIEELRYVTDLLRRRTVEAPTAAEEPL